MIYLDNNATTQPLPEVVEAMLPFLREQYANPSSVHQFGQAVRFAVEQAREKVAALLHAAPREVVFTSGGTESINLAIRGTLALEPKKRQVVTTAVEHSAVLRVMERLTEEGYRVDYVGVDGEGRVEMAEWAEKVTSETALVSLLHANNETGVVQDVQALAAVAASQGAIVHIDAVQSAGKLPIPVGEWPAHLVSIAAHKFHGSKGAGALYVRRRTRIAGMILGGSQERELRGGTENVAGIVGMGVAADAANRRTNDSVSQVTSLRDALERGILERIPGTAVNGAGAERIGNTANISFEGLEAEALLILLSEQGVCASAGSACSSGSLEPSHVLNAMGLPQSRTHGALRFSLSRFNTPDEIDRILALLPGLVSRLTALTH
ncbi:MAG: aminotransferase class V-fold PLP-dependent enzyme [Phycisphaerae bacterium]|nr:aminotransferase class V-fold PLP-dependent enzyme [Phycisphaerae bacterium]